MQRNDMCIFLSQTNQPKNFYQKWKQNRWWLFSIINFSTFSCKIFFLALCRHRFGFLLIQNCYSCLLCLKIGLSCQDHLRIFSGQCQGHVNFQGHIKVMSGSNKTVQHAVCKKTSTRGDDINTCNTCMRSK